MSSVDAVNAQRIHLGQNPRLDRLLMNIGSGTRRQQRLLTNTDTPAVPTASGADNSDHTTQEAPPSLPMPASQNKVETIPSHPIQYDNLPTTSFDLYPHNHTFNEHDTDFTDIYYDYDYDYGLPYNKDDEDDEDNSNTHLSDNTRSTPNPTTEFQSPIHHSLSSNEPDDSNDYTDDEILPGNDFTTAKAFNEIPAVRLTYLQAIQSNTYRGITVLQTNIQLCLTLQCINLSLPDGLQQVPIPATTFKTVKKTVKCHFGINVNDYIMWISICTACFKPYLLEEIVELPSSKCTVH
jgi:hypothetical protein